MNRKTERFCLVIGNLIFAVISCLIWSRVEFKGYSELITFLSILIGFKLTFVSTIFNSSIREILYKRDDREYYTALHRLAGRLKCSLFYEFSAVAVILIFQSIRHIFILPVLATSGYYFVFLVNDFFRCLTYPRNE